MGNKSLLWMHFLSCSLWPLLYLTEILGDLSRGGLCVSRGEYRAKSWRNKVYSVTDEKLWSLRGVKHCMVSRGHHSAMREGFILKLRMKLNNWVTVWPTCSSRSHWGSCSEVGVSFSQTRMSMSVRHRGGGKDNVSKTQISSLTLRQVGAPDVQAGSCHETGCMGQKIRRERRQN